MLHHLVKTRTLFEGLNQWFHIVVCKSLWGYKYSSGVHHIMYIIANTFCVDQY